VSINPESMAYRTLFLDFVDININRTNLTYIWAPIL